jgi:RNA polymerase sigma-54 factor
MSGPGIHQGFQQRQSQQLVLAPQMRQSLKILQVAALDLRAAIQEELQSNPALEELPMGDVSLERAAPAAADEGAAPAGDTGEALDFSRDFSVLEKIGQDWRDHMSDTGGVRSTSREDEERRDHFMDSLTVEKSLSEHLLEQLELSEATPPVREACRYLIGSLDDRGFLTSPLSDIALQSGQPLSVVQEAAKLLKTFDPPGIGAENLTDCLLVQLEQKGRGKSVAARILRDHFDLLVRRRIPDLSRKIGLSPEVVQDAIEEIGALDPAPGRRFAEDHNRVVVPDVTVEREGDEWKITVNSDYIPRLRLSSSYKELIAKGKLTKQEADYLREKLRSGKFIINAIEQRQRTIERLTREIINHQREFFEEGVQKLKPLTMTQIASLLGVHETTVSRAVANKYVKTPHGVFELKFFFTSGYQSESGETVANTSVKETIADIIAGEDPAAPLSDQDIVGLLEQKGLKLARRTVAKYREELGLLPSNLRRRYEK